MCQCECRRGAGFRPLAFLFNLALLYVAMVVGAGTLINTGHPVAVEAGKLLQLATFVEPTIAWAHAQGFEGAAGGLRCLADGIPIPS